LQSLQPRAARARDGERDPDHTHTHGTGSNYGAAIYPYRYRYRYLTLQARASPITVSLARCVHSASTDTASRTHHAIRSHHYNRSHRPKKVISRSSIGRRCRCRHDGCRASHSAGATTRAPHALVERQHVHSPQATIVPLSQARPAAIHADRAADRAAAHAADRIACRAHAAPHAIQAPAPTMSV